MTESTMHQGMGTWLKKECIPPTRNLLVISHIIDDILHDVAIQNVGDAYDEINNLQRHLGGITTNTQKIRDLIARITKLVGIYRDTGKNNPQSDKVISDIVDLSYDFDTHILENFTECQCSTNVSYMANEPLYYGDLELLNGKVVVMARTKKEKNEPVKVGDKFWDSLHDQNGEVIAITTGKPEYGTLILADLKEDVYYTPRDAAPGTKPTLSSAKGWHIYTPGEWKSTILKGEIQEPTRPDYKWSP